MVPEALFFSAILFVIGVVGVLTRRNAIIIFMCVELMLNAVNLSFIGFSRLYGASGQVFVIFVMSVAAAEAAVGLAIIIAIFRHHETVDLKNINLLKGWCSNCPWPNRVECIRLPAPSPSWCGCCRYCR